MTGQIGYPWADLKRGPLPTTASAVAAMSNMAAMAQR